MGERENLTLLDTIMKGWRTDSKTLDCQTACQTAAFQRGDDLPQAPDI